MESSIQGIPHEACRPYSEVVIRTLWISHKTDKKEVTSCEQYIMAYKYMALKWKLYDSTVAIHDLTKNKTWNANLTERYITKNISCEMLV
jgi:hypothetical protein